MTAGLKASIANSILDALCRNVAWTQPGAFWIKLHTGDPGAAGASNAAGNTTRQQATFSAAAAGSITTSGDVTWTNVNTAETYTHFSFWDASTAGNFLGSSVMTAPKLMAVGDNFTIPAGSEVVGLTPVAA